MTSKNCGVLSTAEISPNVIADILMDALLENIDFNRLKADLDQEVNYLRMIAGALRAPRGDAS